MQTQSSIDSSEIKRHYVDITNSLLSQNFNDVNSLIPIVSNLLEDSSTHRIENRFHLRLNLENAILEAENVFFRDSQSLEDSISKFDDDLAAVENRCQNATSDLNICRRTTRHILKKAQVLRIDRDLVKCKQQICDKLLSILKLPVEKYDIIVDKNKGINQDFFNALECVQIISNNAASLVEIETNYEIRDRQYISRSDETLLSNIADSNGQFAKKDINDTADEESIRKSYEGSAVSSLGLDVMQYSSFLFDVAHERLFSWILEQCRNLIALLIASPHLWATVQRWITSAFTNGEPRLRANNVDTLLKPISIEIDSVVFERSVRELRNRPVYFANSLENIFKVRKRLLVQAFYDSSINETNGAFDTFKYISDIFEWLNEKATSELEFILAIVDLLFEENPTRFQNSQTQQGVYLGSGLTIQNFQRLIEMLYEDLCGCIRERILHIFMSQYSSASVPYSLSRLFKSYRCILRNYDNAVAVLERRPAYLHSLKHQLPPQCREGSLVSLCKELYDAAMSSALSIVEEKTLMISQLPSNLVYSYDGNAPIYIVEAMSVLKDIFKVEVSFAEKNKSLIEQPSNADLGATKIMDGLRNMKEVQEETTRDVSESEADTSVLLDSLINPLLNFCRQSASFLAAIDSSVYLINCYSYIQNVLKSHEMTVSRVQLLTELVAEEMEALCVEQTNYVLKAVGFHQRLIELRKAPPGCALESIPCLHRMSLASCFRSFYANLISYGTLYLPSIESISSRHIRAEARQKVISAVVKAYSQLYEASQSLDLLARTPEDVRLLMDV